MSGPPLSRTEHERIEAAVARAEASTGGEFVPVIAAAASDYPAAGWRAGALLAAGTGVCLLAIYSLTDALLFAPIAVWLLALLASFVLGMALIQQVPGLKRRFTGREERAEQLLLQAKRAFFDCRVHDTDQRTGVLIHLSLFERRAVILADVGLAELVPDSAWQAVMAHLTESWTKDTTLADRLEVAIEECAQLLVDSGIQAADDDAPNELADGVRIHD